MSITAVHHLDCCSMCPVGGPLFWGRSTPRMCGHVLLLETSDRGLVLVDSGVGEADRRHRARRMGAVGVLGGFPTDLATSAISQIRGLGFDPADVRHIAVTHFDLDHAGGICDFPGATLHLLDLERQAAQNPSARERARYCQPHVAAVSNWSTYPLTGEPWRGFSAAQALAGLDGDVLIVPLTGHSRGHAAIAVNAPDGWLLHCGDGYFHRGRLTGGAVPIGLRAFERLVALDYERVLSNHAHLAEVLRTDPDLRVFSAHDTQELNQLRDPNPVP